MTLFKVFYTTGLFLPGSSIPELGIWLHHVLLPLKNSIRFEQSLIRLFDLFLITSAHSTSSRWMVDIFVQDSLFSNHNISYKLDKLSGHLTGRKASINCSKGHSVQLSCTALNCHQIWTAISSITHPTRMTTNVRNCPPILWWAQSSWGTHMSLLGSSSKGHCRNTWREQRLSSTSLEEK